MPPHITSVPLDKAYRLINHGPVVLVSARHEGVVDVMAASWACALDYAPPRLTVVIDRNAATRRLVEGSGVMVVQVPTAAQLDLTYRAGSLSLAQDPDKLDHCGIELFAMDGHTQPCVAGCAAWLECRILDEPHTQARYDLFIAEVTAAWADNRVFRDGRWQFADCAPELRSLHYIAGGQFYAIGEALQATPL